MTPPELYFLIFWANFEQKLQDKSIEKIIS
nr:MAG TPA: hypothetical protein [Caudoviricetes sp.]